jgi:hypothetical protein
MRNSLYLIASFGGFCFARQGDLPLRRTDLHLRSSSDWIVCSHLLDVRRDLLVTWLSGTRDKRTQTDQKKADGSPTHGNLQQSCVRMSNWADCNIRLFDRRRYANWQNWQRDLHQEGNKWRRLFSVLSGNDEIADSVLHEIGIRVKTERSHDSVFVKSHGACCDIEHSCSLLHRASLCEKLQHFALSRCE